MKKTISGILILGIFSIASGCNFPGLNVEMSSPDLTALYQTVAVTLTENAKITSQNPIETTSTATPTPLPAIEFITSTPFINILPAQTGTEIILCDRAKAGIPLDVTVFDYEEFYPGESFTKTWRIKNNGSCTWTPQYSVIQFHGDQLGLTTRQNLSENVEPGKTVDISVDMMAPMEQGTYQSYWMLENPAGMQFGLGPHGDAPFWVLIVVKPTATVTSMPTAVPTVTPAVLIEDQTILDPNAKLDLDSGIQNNLDEDDLAYTLNNDSSKTLDPVNGARMGLILNVNPSLAECENASYSSDPFDLANITNTETICYRTNLGMPGRMQIEIVDDLKIKITFLTWALP
jgi:hypothetical protein